MPNLDGDNLSPADAAEIATGQSCGSDTIQHCKIEMLNWEWAVHRTVDVQAVLDAKGIQTLNFWSYYRKCAKVGTGVRSFLNHFKLGFLSHRCAISPYLCELGDPVRKSD